MLQCKNCNNALSEGAKFCPFCGTPVEAETDEKPKKGINFVAVIAAALAVLVVTVVFAIIALNPKSEMFIDDESSWNTFYNDDYDAVIVYNGKTVVEFDDDYSDYTISNNNKSMFILLEDESLYVITEKGEKLIDEDVHDYFVYTNDDKLLYIKDYESDSETGDLYIWNGKKSSYIDSDVESFITVSPDSKTIIYHKEIEIFDPGCEVYMSRNGRKGKLCEDWDRIVLAISNDRKTRIEFEHSTFDNNLFFVTKNEEYEMGYSGDVGDIVVNSSFTEVIYEHGTNLYLMEKGQDREKIYKDIDTFRFCVPRGKHLNQYSTNMVTVAEVDTFRDKLLEIETRTSLNDVISIDKNLEANIYLECVSDLVLAEDEKTMYYIDEDDVLCEGRLKRKGVDAKEIEEDIDDYRVTSDGKFVAYMDDEDELFLYNGNGSVSVEEDVQLYRLAENGNLYYFEDGSGEMILRSNKGDTHYFDDIDNVAYIVNCDDCVLIIDEHQVLYRVEGEELYELCDDIEK